MLFHKPVYLHFLCGHFLPCVIISIDFLLCFIVGWRDWRDHRRGGVQRSNWLFGVTRLARRHWRHATDNPAIHNLWAK